MAVNTVEKKENKTKELEQWMQMASPFAIHEGEIMVDEKAEEYGHYIELDPFQTEIVKSVNALLFATRQLIKKYLIRQGAKVKDKLLDKQLKRLSYNNYLRKMACVSPDGSKSVSKTYTLDRKGKGFLRHMGVKVRLEGYVNDRIRTPGQVKKILAANQAMLAIAGNDKDIYIETAKMYIVNEKHPRNRLFREINLMDYAAVCRSKKRNEVYACLVDKNIKVFSTRIAGTNQYYYGNGEKEPVYLTVDKETPTSVHIVNRDAFEKSYEVL